jgi:AcrR family transcriptional regulator
MGLRAVKVERTRAQIVEVAQDLFLDQGYAATTMEQVAEAAEVGTSTLYRYFPSKELLLLEPFSRAFVLGRLLEARPAGEALDVALGACLREAFPLGDLDRDRFVALRQIVDREPGPRARLWDLVDQETRSLERQIAHRLGCAADDVRVVLAARNALVVWDLIGRRWVGRTRRSWEQAVDRVLATLADAQPVLPRSHRAL